VHVHDVVQAALQGYLHQHLFGSASAVDVLGLFLQLTPPNMASSSVAATTGWQSPGSPVIALRFDGEVGHGAVPHEEAAHQTANAPMAISIIHGLS
jgi:hypothetical protein